MMNSRSHCRCLRSRTGAALVVILAFSVLLTGLVVAFLTRAITERQISDSSANQTKVEILAGSAVDYILGDLKQEIVAKSDQPDPDLAIYYPKTAADMLPIRSGNPEFATPGDPLTDPIPNLVRRSWSEDSNLPVRSRASAANSTARSANGRSISLSRWNAHYLIPRANAGVTDVETAPVASFAAPDWVFVTREGPEVITAPSREVIGRYAFAIYDEGGLLDANVAGFPSGLTAAQRGEKGSLALADLTSIGLAAGEIDKMIGWRNYATLKPMAGQTLENYDFSADAISSTNFYDYIRKVSNGFMAVNPVTYAGRTDQAFSSRQALLRFRRATGFSQDALQYLGTFSRDLEQPSFRPDPDRPKNTTHTIATSGAAKESFGGNDANHPTLGPQQDLINPALLAVRSADGALVMKRRFPLSRLGLLNEASEKLLGGTSVPSALGEKIQKYFGLSWDAVNARWNYGQEEAGKICRLSEVPSGREPDFVETLKAVIHCDSLGKQLGGTGANNSPHMFISNAAAIDGKVNYQIIQIAANLIDQYDEDSYPTRIYYDAREFFGVENLPYLAGWMQSWYRIRQLTAADIDPARQPPGGLFPYETWVMYQPILWNPHALDTRSSVTDVPVDFRIAAGGVAGTAVSIRPLVRPAWWQSGAVSSYPARTGWTSSAFSDATVDPASSFILFNAVPNTSAGVAAAFQEPCRLKSPNYPPGSNATNAPGYAAGRFNVTADPTLASYDGSVVIGFFGGRCWTGPSGAASPFATGGENPRCLSRGYASANLQLKLQYRNPYGSGPDWLVYDVIEQAHANSQSFSTVDNADAGTEVRGFRTAFRVDPRTDRWGLFEMNTFPLAANPAGLGDPSNNGITGPVYQLPDGATLFPNAGAAGVVYRLRGNNNGLPYAPGWQLSPQPQPTGSAIGDLMVNLNSGTNASVTPGNKAYYNDPDGVLRRASGACFAGSDGLPLRTGNFASRPVVLNRAFRTVAEMGYAFRGTPWKEIDFFTPESGDAALLDAFALNDLDQAPGDVVVAGRTNLNTRQSRVIEALIRGVAKAEGQMIDDQEALAAAQALVGWTSDITSESNGVMAKGPLRNRSELVGKWVSRVAYTRGQNVNPPNPNIDGSKSYNGYSALLGSGSDGIFAAAADAAIKTRRECILRALADSGNVRTWNLLIDIVAQTGRFSAAPGGASDLSKFVVQGETRYWVHVAIDRFTGEVIAKEMEPVSE